MKILVLGVTGMLGHAVFRMLYAAESMDVWGTLRGVAGLSYFTPHMQASLLADIDVLDQDKLIRVFERIKPDWVINCVGIIKQLSTATDPKVVLPINALLPHRLAELCAVFNAKLIHISTDCVFSGKQGAYVESDPSDAEDLYGQSKYEGEVRDLSHVLTIRTSLIGHELQGHCSLVDWFLSQRHSVKGYTKAIFSGFPTIELARIIRDYILPNTTLSGVYHIAATPIHKYDLLRLIAERYKKDIVIIPDATVVIDRSLDGRYFSAQTGYHAPPWPVLIAQMHQTRQWLSATV